MARRVDAEADRRRLARSVALAGAGDGVVAVALPLLAAGLTRDPLLVAGVAAAHHLPWAALAVLGSGVLGAGDQRTVLGLASTLRAATVALVGVVALAGVETLLVVAAAAVVLGLGEALAGTVEASADPIASDGLARRGMVGLAAVGLPLGGLLFAATAGLPFLVAIGIFALAALGALTLQPRPAEDTPAPGAGRTGVTSLVPGTGAVTAVAAVSNGASGAVLGVLVLFALDDLAVGPLAFSLVLMALAGAAAAGASLAPTVGQLLGLRRGAAAALVAAGVGYLGAGLVADPADPLVAVAGLAVGAGAGMAAAVLVDAVLHLDAPMRRRDQALAAFHVRVWAAVPVGALVGGVVARSTGVRAAVVVAGVVLALAALAAAGVAQGGKTPVAEKSG